MGNKSKGNPKPKPKPKKKFQIHQPDTGIEWVKEVKSAIDKGDKKKLEELLKMVNANTWERYLLELMLYKWERNEWKDNDWVLGREVNNSPLCRRYVSIYASCSDCALFKMTGNECYKADHQDELREGKKDLLLARLGTLVKEIQKEAIRRAEASLQEKGKEKKDVE